MFLPNKSKGYKRVEHEKFTEHAPGYHHSHMSEHDSSGHSQPDASDFTYNGIPKQQEHSGDHGHAHGHSHGSHNHSGHSHGGHSHSHGHSHGGHSHSHGGHGGGGGGGGASKKGTIPMVDSTNPAYDGIQYDKRIPDGIVVASPGGVASNYHHWTKGFYGVGGSSSDIQGFDQPRYPQGVYGNLYRRGPSSAELVAGYNPDFPGQYYKLWENKSDIDDSYEPVAGSVITGAEQNIRGGDGGTEPGMVIENYSSTGVSSSGVSQFNLKNMAVTLLLVVLASIAITLWISAGTHFIREKLHKGKDLKYTEYAVYAVAFTAIAIIAYWLAGDSLGIIQTV